MSAEADVYRGDRLAGRISRTRHGAVFEYDARFEDEVAFRLPRAAGRYETTGVNLHTFFAGLLPEGLRLTTLVRHMKTSRDDLLSLLMAVGADCVGDVAVVPVGQRPRDAAPALDPRRAAELSFDEVLQESLGSTREAAIPGVQEKVSAAMISVPVRAGGAFILKLNPPRVPRLVENEHFFMKAARACGLATAEVKLLHDRDGRSGLLVTRFDRLDAGKLHQEDACQLLDLYPADKYRLSMRQVMEALEVCSAPTIERLKLLRLVAYSYLIGNGDLHAKNISVRIIEGRVELTPAYDLLTTLPYGDAHMALKLDGRVARLGRRSFVALGERFGVPARAVEAMLDELLASLRPFHERLDEIGFEKRRTDALARALRSRADGVAKSMRSR